MVYFRLSQQSWLCSPLGHCLQFCFWLCFVGQSLQSSARQFWAMQPGAADWWLMCAKSMIVNIAPTVPMMYCLITRPSQQCLKYSAIWTYCVLGANVVWTLGFLPMAFNAVSCINGMTGASLTISLIIHECALMSKGVVLFEVS